MSRCTHTVSKRTTLIRCKLHTFRERDFRKEISERRCCSQPSQPWRTRRRNPSSAPCPTSRALSPPPSEFLFALRLAPARRRAPSSEPAERTNKQLSTTNAGATDARTENKIATTNRESAPSCHPLAPASSRTSRARSPTWRANF